MLHLALWKKLKRTIMRRSMVMMSVSQIEEALREIMGPQADELAKKTGFIRRKRKEGVREAKKLNPPRCPLT